MLHLALTPESVFNRLPSAPNKMRLVLARRLPLFAKGTLLDFSPLCPTLRPSHFSRRVQRKQRLAMFNRRSSQELAPTLAIYNLVRDTNPDKCL